jgi:hypothetical protein
MRETLKRYIEIRKAQPGWTDEHEVYVELAYTLVARLADEGTVAPVSRELRAVLDKLAPQEIKVDAWDELAQELSASLGD